MNTLLQRMKAALIADDTLQVYLDSAVEIRKWNSDQVPDFDKYCVVLSPEDPKESSHGILGVEQELPVEIICLVKYHGIEETLTGETTPDGVGLHKLLKDVRSVLRANSLSGYVEADADSVAAPWSTDPVFEGSLLLMMGAFRYVARRKVQTN